jgi:hypothetical protein
MRLSSFGDAVPVLVATSDLVGNPTSPISPTFIKSKVPRNNKCFHNCSIVLHVLLFILSFVEIILAGWWYVVSPSQLFTLALPLSHSLTQCHNHSHLGCTLPGLLLASAASPSQPWARVCGTLAFSTPLTQPFDFCFARCLC